MNKRLIISTPLTLALAFGLAACGGDDDDAASEPTADDTASASTTDSTMEESSSAEMSSSMEEASSEGATPGDGPTIVIGAQDFGESAILAELYGQALDHAGYSVEQQALGGYRDVVFTTFDSGDINFTAEYAASALEFLNGGAGEASGDIATTAAALQEQLTTRGLTALDASPAVDSNSFVVTAETAEELGLSKVSDLTDDLRLGGPEDCTENASCIPGLVDTYGIDLSANFVPLDGGGPLTVAALEGGEIDVAILFSTDGTIADKGWVVLEDDMQLINADNIIPVTTDEVVSVYGEAFTSLVNQISAALSTDELTELNRRYGIDAEDADVVATDWLTDEGFLS